MTNKTYHFDVEVLRAGQPRPYADSEYEYIVRTDEKSEWTIEKFCTCVLRPCSQKRSDWSKRSGDADKYFLGYYIFEKVSENTYKYYVREPYDD